MPSSVCSSPVASPANIPAANAATSAAGADQPDRISITVTAPPVAKEPSTVRSAKSSILKVRKTPSAMIPQISPWATLPGRAEISAVISMSKSFVCDNFDSN